MGNTPNIFDTLAQQDTQRTQHDQTVAQPQQSQQGSSIFDQMAQNNGQAPEPGKEQQQPKGPSIGPQGDTQAFDKAFPNGVSSDPFERIKYRMAAPFARKAMDAVDKLREVENFTQEGHAEHPVQSFMGHIANRLEGFLFGNEQHPEDAIGSGKQGMLTNPVTSALIPGAEGTPAAASALEGGANLVKSGYQAVKGAVTGGEGAEGGASLLKQAIKGKEIAQEPAKAAIRTAVGANEDAAILEGNTTAADKKLEELSSKSADAYKRRDAIAGFDTKAEETALRNNTKKLRRMSEDEAVDVKVRGKEGQMGEKVTYNAEGEPEYSQGPGTPDQSSKDVLESAIKRGQDRLAAAAEKMKAAGIDPQEADSLHKQIKAGGEFKKALVQATSPDGESVNIDQLLNASKKLRTLSKYGDRLEQFMGKEGADKFMSDLMKAQELGAHSMKAQELGKKILLYGGPTLAGVTAGGVAVHQMLR